MGNWDIYCFICGNTCHKYEYYPTDELDEFLRKKDNDKITKKSHKNKTNETKKIEPKKEQSKKSKNNNDKNNNDILKQIKDFEKNTKWLEDCVMLLANDEVEKNCKEISGDITFKNKNGTYTALTENTIENPYSLMYGSQMSGIFLHTDCYKFVEKENNFSLKYSNLPVIKGKKEYTEKSINISYGEIEKYWSQYFDFTNVIRDNKMYLCSSPLLNDKNIKQIKKNISLLKLKNEEDRVGPSVSATFYKDGDIKIGNNRKLWIKKNNKWNEINKPIINLKIKSKREGYDKNTLMLSFIAQYNKYGIFVKNIIKIKNQLIYDIITIDDNLEMIKKNFIVI